jgi:hypothetical protein
MTQNTNSMTIEQETDEAPKEQTLHVASLATGAITQGDDNTITETTSSKVRMNLTFNIFLKKYDVAIQLLF